MAGSNSNDKNMIDCKGTSSCLFTGFKTESDPRARVTGNVLIYNLNLDFRFPDGSRYRFPNNNDFAIVDPTGKFSVRQTKKPSVGKARRGSDKERSLPGFRGNARTFCAVAVQT
jgi:hypothetical protein